MPLPKLTKNHTKLKEMFPQLRNHEPVEEWERSSYNDDGSDHFTLWEGPECHYITQWNSWGGPVHPWTALTKVKRYEHKEWRYKEIEEKVYYGNLEFTQ